MNDKLKKVVVDIDELKIEMLEKIIDGGVDSPYYCSAEEFSYNFVMTLIGRGGEKRNSKALEFMKRSALIFDCCSECFGRVPKGCTCPECGLCRENEEEEDG